MSDDIAGACKECGASVYKQHLSSGIARNEDDKLLCAHCVTELKRSEDGTGDDDGLRRSVYHFRGDDADLVGRRRSLRAFDRGGGLDPQSHGSGTGRHQSPRFCRI